MSVFNIKRYGEYQEVDTSNELDLLEKLKKRIKPVISTEETATNVEERELKDELPEKIEAEENETEGKKKRKRKRKSSLSKDTGFTTLGDVSSKEKSKVRRVLPMVSSTRHCFCGFRRSTNGSG